MPRLAGLTVMGAATLSRSVNGQTQVAASTVALATTRNTAVGCAFDSVYF